MGITRVASITGLDYIGLPVYTCFRPNSRSLSVSQGKGTDDQSAMASAFMEAAESWHAENIDLPTVFASPGDMRLKHRIEDCRHLLRHPSSVILDYVPIMWLKGFDLMSQEDRYVPFEVVSVYYIEEILVRRTFFQSSNGLASGNSVMEASIHGIYELIERHSVMEFEALDVDSRRARRLDLSTVQDPRCLEILRLLRKAEVEIVVFDATGSVGVPTFRCSIFDHWDTPRWSAKGICGGFGTHLSPEVALSRAVTEAIQSRLTKIAGSRDDIVMSSYELKAERRVLKRLSEEFGRVRPDRRFPDRMESTMFLDQDLEILIGKLEAANIKSLIVVDLTNSELGLPVVKVIVPGLRHLGAILRNAWS